jgi:hypothetical protein
MPQSRPLPPVHVAPVYPTLHGPLTRVSVLSLRRSRLLALSHSSSSSSALFASPGTGAAMAMRTAVSTVLTTTRPGSASLGGHTSLHQRVYPPKILTCGHV